jgi:hypothetical protein
MVLSLSMTKTGVVGDVRYWIGDITFDSSYLTGGESLTSSDLGFDIIHTWNFENTSGYSFEYDSANSKIIAYTTAITNSATNSASILVTDDNSAASNGVAIYLHISDDLFAEGTKIGHIESVTAGNADVEITLTNGGPSVPIIDDNAASTLGNQLYFDEDASAVDGRILADLDLPGDVDAFIMVSNGEFIRVNDDDSASSNGVALYVDDNASNTYERLLFVSPTNADGTGRCDDQVGMRIADAAIAQVGSTVDLSSVVVRTMVWGS